MEQSLNLAWVLIAGFLVMFMQAGFAMVETGFTRSRNAAHTMALNLLIYPLGVLGYWLVGYGLMWGGVQGWPTLGGPATGGREVALHLGGQAWGFFGAARFALVTVAGDPAAVAPRDPALASRNRAARRSRRLALGAAIAAVSIGLASLVWLSHRYAGPPVPTPAARTR